MVGPRPAYAGTAAPPGSAKDAAVGRRRRSMRGPGRKFTSFHHRFHRVIHTHFSKNTWARRDDGTGSATGFATGSATAGYGDDGERTQGDGRHSCSDRGRTRRRERAECPAPSGWWSDALSPRPPEGVQGHEQGGYFTASVRLILLVCAAVQDLTRAWYQVSDQLRSASVAESFPLRRRSFPSLLTRAFAPALPPCIGRLTLPSSASAFRIGRCSSRSTPRV